MENSIKTAVLGYEKTGEIISVISNITLEIMLYYQKEKKSMPLEHLSTCDKLNKYPIEFLKEIIEESELRRLFKIYTIGKKSYYSIRTEGYIPRSLAPDFL